MVPIGWVGLETGRTVRGYLEKRPRAPIFVPGSYESKST